MSEDKQKKVPPISYESAAEEIWHNSPDTFLTIEEMEDSVRRHESEKVKALTKELEQLRMLARYCAETLICGWGVTQPTERENLIYLLETYFPELKGANWVDIEVALNWSKIPRLAKEPPEEDYIEKPYIPDSTL